MKRSDFFIVHPLSDLYDFLLRLHGTFLVKTILKSTTSAYRRKGYKIPSFVEIVTFEISQPLENSTSRYKVVTNKNLYPIQIVALSLHIYLMNTVPHITRWRDILKAHEHLRNFLLCDVATISGFVSAEKYFFTQQTD